jgi:hypothetical protein
VESEASDDLESLYVRVYSPADEQGYLSILERDDCIEIGFSDRDPPGGAENQILCEEGSESLGVAAAIEYVQEIIDEKVVIGRERSTWLTGHKPLPPQFLAPSKERFSAFVPGKEDTIGSRQGKHDDTSQRPRTLSGQRAF